MIDFGVVPPGTKLYVPFNTFDSNDPSGSVTITGLATTDIEIYKDESVTQRASDAGYALIDTDGIDIDGTTGIHEFSVDLANNTTAGFFSSGSRYKIVVASVTVDAGTVNFIAAVFTIGYPNALINTTIATLASQTSFTLTSGPAEDDALNGMWCVIHDVASVVQMGYALISDYTGSTKTVSLVAGTTFTAVATDNVAIMGLAPLQPTTLGATLGVTATGAATLNWGDVENKTTTHDFTNTTINTVTTNTDMRGTDSAATATEMAKVPKSDGTDTWNATALASINTEVDSSIVTYGLDHLVAVAVADEVVDDSIIAKMVDASSTADWSVYVHTEDSLRAISENVNGIGTATGGGFKFAPLSDDVLEDLIDNAGAAVDKGTTPATVGIPVTGAAAAGWVADDECTIALTTNYNGQQVIDSVTTNEIVIVATYNAETFGAADTIKRTIKATRIVGTEDSGTFASVSAIDGVVHQIGDTANAFTISYRFAVGGSRLATEAVFTGFLNSGNDGGLLQAYNFTASAWETRELLPGQGGSVNQTLVIPLLAHNTGSSGVELGQVLLRIKDDGGGSSPTLNTDSLLVEAIGIGRSGGYQNGQIWVDSVNGTDGSELDTHGTSTIPCKTWANIVALVATSLPSDVHVLNGSTLTLDSTALNYSFFGDHWSLALGAQACGGVYVQGATVSGIATSAGEEMHFEGCDIGTSTVEQGHFDKCGFTGTLTMNTADDYEFHGCYNKTATTAIFTKTASVNITAEWVDWSGSITLSGIQASSSYILAGTEIGDVILNGADGTVEVRGIYKSITDNRTGSPTLTISGAVQAGDVAKIPLSDGTVTWNSTALASINAEADTALTDYDPPTNTEMEARTPTAAQLAYMVENSNTGLPVTFTTSGGSTTVAVLNLVDGGAGSATDDQYNGRLLVFTDGTLKGVVTDITDYTGSTTTATITAIPTAPTSSHNARLI